MSDALKDSQSWLDSYRKKDDEELRRCRRRPSAYVNRFCLCATSARRWRRW